MTIHARPDPLADRYSVRSYGSRDMAMVYVGNTRFAGPCSWAAAKILADTHNEIDRRNRQQDEAAPDDFPEYGRSASQADREYQFRSEQ